MLLNDAKEALIITAAIMTIFIVICAITAYIASVNLDKEIDKK